MLYDEKYCKKEAPKTPTTQAFDIDGPAVIEIPVNKDDMESPRIKGYAVTYMKTSSYNSRIPIQ